MSIIKIISTKIRIHKSCYFFLFLSILLGNFHAVFFSSFFLLIHECGHFFTAHLLKWKTDNITFYPFGGISKFSSDVNCPIEQEILVLLMGPVFQCLLYSFFKGFPLTPYQDTLLTLIHYNLLLFNLLPIYPLDGGRILHCFSCYFLSYQKSFRFIYGFSYLIFFLLFSFFLFYQSLSLFLVLLLLLFRMMVERKNIRFYKERFLLERYLKKYSFPKTKIVQKEDEFQRQCSHIIKKNNWYQSEEDYLIKKYQGK